MDQDKDKNKETTGNNVPTKVEGKELATKQPMIGNLPVDVRVGKNGVIQAVAFKVKLTVADGDIYGISYYDSDAKGWKKRYMVSAQGYQRLNSFAGIHIITPKTLIINGQEHNNPYIERDSDGMKKTVYVRKIGLGRGPGGNLIALDQTLSYCAADYLRRDIQNIKAKGVCKNIVKNENFKEKEGFWYVKIFDNLFMEIDLNHEDVIKCIKTYQERINFSERLAATIVERNIMKKHPAISKGIVRPNEKGEIAIPIISWRESDMDMDKVNAVAVAVSEGRRPDGVDVLKENGNVSEDDIEDSSIAEGNDLNHENVSDAEIINDFIPDDNPPEEPEDTGNHEDEKSGIIDDLFGEEPEKEKKPEPVSKKEEPKKAPEPEKKIGDDPEKVKKVIKHILEMKITLIEMLKAEQEWAKIMKEHAPDLQGSDGPDLATLSLTALKKIQGACQKAL